VKANQSNLFRTSCAIADNTAPADTTFSRDTGRSRQEDRTVEVFPVADALAGSEWQPFIKTVIRVTRRTLLYSAATGLWNQRGEVALYVSSADGVPATEWAAAIRGHWGIENRNHYVRDVSYDEDKSRIRDNPGIMARARSFALNILRKNDTTNVAQALWNGALNLNHILAYNAI
jgi:predicted transposase YbfD/YdcC